MWTLFIIKQNQIKVFKQWLNQTHNALVNYANRNAKTPVSTAQQVVGYTAAVTSAMGVATLCNKQLLRHGHKLKVSFLCLIV